MSTIATFSGTLSRVVRDILDVRDAHRHYVRLGFDSNIAGPADLGELPSRP